MLVDEVGPAAYIGLPDIVGLGLSDSSEFRNVHIYPSWH